MPWEWLWHGDQYANHFSGPDRAFRYFDGWAPYLANEPLWNFFAAATTPIAEQIGWRNWVRLISFFSLFVLAYFVLSRSPSRYWAIALLLITSPLILNNYISGVRQTLAIAVFLLALMSPRFLKIPIILVTPLIHSTFFIALPFYFLALTDWVSFRAKVWITAFVALSLLLLVPILSEELGARQAERFDFGFDLTIRPLWIYLLFIVVVFFLSGPRFMREHQVAITGMMFYIFSAPLGGADVAGRTIENFFPFMFIALSYLRGIAFYIIFAATLPAIAFLWMRGIT
ncbi:EpsG family protein [Halorhodospira halochloris]|uniref:EpsG family protein n=1 Tax=Halorhodospira halochloris TaxID=1052 RepID=UPI001EE939D0|nr:EpsG family protein [Halorhodospira halochloris]MCG5531127.1 EpsG family protein [Halorhodospira halochloris]